MKARDIVIGGVIVLAIGFLLLRSQISDNTPEIEENVPMSSEETENRLEEVLGRTIPENAEKATLSDVSGNNYSAIATRSEDNDVVEFTVLADLSEVEDSEYQVWAGESAENLHSLGTLTSAKGGYLFEYRQATELSSFNNVVVSLEKKVDELMEEKILQGSF